MRPVYLLALCLSIASTAGAENDFTGAADLIAWWRFESGADFRLDSSGNGNHFTAAGQMGEGTTTAWNTSDKQEGTASVDFESANNNYLSLSDASLTAGFPGKSGTSNNVWSVCCWVKLESLPGAGDPDWNYRMVCGKWRASKYSWTSTCGNNGANCQQILGVGYNSGGSAEWKYNTSVNLATGTWYHMFWSFNGADQSYQLQVKTVAGAVYRASGNTTNAMNIEDEVFSVGRAEGAALAEMDGLLDHLVIFNDVLSYTEANSVAADTYDCAADANCVAEYSFDLAGMGLDSSDTGNDLPVPVSNAVTYKEGASSCYCNGTYVVGMDVLDAGLSAGFPGKSGADNNDVYTVLCWFQLASQPAGTQTIAGKVWSAATFENNSWALGTNSGATRALGCWFDGGAASEELAQPERALSTGVWYHIATILDPSTDRVYTRLYDTSNTTVYTAEDLTATLDMQVTVDSFRVGAPVKPNVPGNAIASPFFGYLDELVIFHRALTDDEIDEIRGGTYSGSTGVNNWWWRRRHTNLMQWDSWKIVLPETRRAA